MCAVTWRWRYHGLGRYKYLINQQLQSKLEACVMKCHEMVNHITCMAHVIQLVLGAFMSSLKVEGHTKCWEADERDQQIGENYCCDIGKSQRHRKEGNALINILCTMKPGFATIIEKVCISTYSERPETDQWIVENACCIEFADTWSSKRVCWMSTSQCNCCGTTYYRFPDWVEIISGDASLGLPMTRIHLLVAAESTIQWLPACEVNTGWIEYRHVGHGRVIANLVLDDMDVKKAYGDSELWYHCIQQQVWPYRWCCGTMCQEEDIMLERLMLCREVCMLEPVKILYCI